MLFKDIYIEEHKVIIKTSGKCDDEQRLKKRALCTFARLKTYFDLITRQGPGQGYHPEPSKSVLIVRLENIEAGKVFGARHGFKLCMVVCYLRGYIRNVKSKHDCLREPKITWEKNIITIS